MLTIILIIKIIILIIIYIFTLCISINSANKCVVASYISSLLDNNESYNTLTLISIASANSYLNFSVDNNFSSNYNLHVLLSW